MNGEKALAEKVEFLTKEVLSLRFHIVRSELYMTKLLASICLGNVPVIDAESWKSVVNKVVDEMKFDDIKKHVEIVLKNEGKSFEPDDYDKAVGEGC